MCVWLAPMNDLLAGTVIALAASANILFTLQRGRSILYISEMLHGYERKAGGER